MIMNRSKMKKGFMIWDMVFINMQDHWECCLNTPRVDLYNDICGDMIIVKQYGIWFTSQFIQIIVMLILDLLINHCNVCRHIIFSVKNERETCGFENNH